MASDHEELRPRRQEALDDACLRIAREYEARGAFLRLPEGLDLVPERLRQRLRIFSVPSPLRPAGWVIVATGPWDNMLRAGVINFVVACRGGEEGRGASRFELLSAEPAPDFIAWAAEDSVRGRLERDALACVRRRPVLPPSEATSVANQGRASLARHVGRTDRMDRHDQLEALSRVVLENVRGAGIDPHAPLPARSHQPWDTLVMIGCVVGETIRTGELLAGEWRQEDERRYGAGLALSVWDRRLGDAPVPGAQLLCNPIGRAARLFVNGAEDDFVALAYAVLEQAYEASALSPGA